MEAVKEGKKRIPWVDMAKGYGILAIFTGHLVEGTIIGDFVYSFHLPLFFFLSGYLFKADMSFGKFISKKARSILLPYFILGLPVVFFSVYYPLVFTGLVHKWLVNPAVLWDAFCDGLIKFFIQNRYGTMWYLAVLFGLNILAFILAKIPKESIRLILVIAIASAGIFYYSKGGVALPWNVDVVLTALPFFWLGYFFSKHDFLYGLILQQAKWKRILLWLLMMTVNIGANIRSFRLTGEGLEMFWNHYGSPLWVYLSAFAGILGVVIFSSLFSWKPLTYIGEHSMLFFMWHQAIFFELWKEMYPRWGIPDIWEYIYAATDPLKLFVGLTALILAQIIPTLIIIWLLVELLRRTPLKRMV